MKKITLLIFLLLSGIVAPAIAMLKTTMTRFVLAVCAAYDRIFKVTHTISDFYSCENILFQYTVEVIGYRNLGRKSLGT